MTTIFFGTSQFCLPILDSLNENFDLKLVVTRPDKPVGRKKTLTPSATKSWAIEHKIDSITPESLKKDTQDLKNVLSAMEKIKPDVIIVADFGLIIPETIFNFPKHKTFNIHFSKLPDLRGPSPVQFTLLRGETDAWVTIFELEKQMDTGPILWQQSFPIDPADTTQTLYTRLFEQVAPLLPEILKSYVLNPKSLLPQQHEKSTLCRYLTKDDGFVDWEVLQKAISGDHLTMADLPQIQQEALETNKKRLATSHSIYDFFRAVSPWPGMWTMKDEERMIIRKCHLAAGKLILDQIQYEGQTPTDL